MGLRNSTLRNDGNHLERLETQLGVTRDFDLGQSGLTVDPFSEDAPCNFLRDGRFRKLIPERLFAELPRLFSAREIPTAAAFTGNGDLNVSSGLCRNGAIGERQGPQEAIQNGMVEFAGHDARFVHRQPDLLLVVPAFRELPGGVEPVCGFFLACPAYAVGRAGIGIPGAVIVSKQLGGDLHQGNQDSGTQASIDTDAFLIQTVDVCREFSARADSWVFWQISIAGDRDAAKRSIQKMCGDVLDLPLRSE